ncbi:MAG: hypothetical protein LC745_08950, partial [Planctomycetia bacterium]|nr:hypothetical protein [Planctomycetia bacterium]
LDAARTGLIPPAELPIEVQVTTLRLIKNYETAVQTLLNASPNVRVAVWTLPDVSITPIARQAAAGNPAAAALLQGIGQATQEFNAAVKSLGANPRVAVVDLAAAAAQAAGSPTGSIPFGGQTISLINPSDDYHSFFLADQLHVGTVAQGIIADTFVQAIDAKFGEQLFPITPTEIVRYAQQVQRTTAHPHGPQMY